MTKNDKLLNEQTLRRWAKLADISVINQDLLISEDVDTETEEETVTESTDTEEEEEVTEEAIEEEPVIELTEEDDMPGEEGMEDMEDMEDMEVDADEGAEENDVVMAVLKALAPFGVEMDDDEAEGEMEMEPEAEAEPAMDHPMKDEDPAMYDDPAMGDSYNRQDEEELTEAVLKRVLKRISELNDK